MTFRIKNEPLVVPDAFEEKPELFGVALEEEPDYDDYNPHKRVWTGFIEVDDVSITLEVLSAFMNLRTEDGLKERQFWSYKAIMGIGSIEALFQMKRGITSFDKKDSFEKECLEQLPTFKAAIERYIDVKKV